MSCILIVCVPLGGGIPNFPAVSPKSQMGKIVLYKVIDYCPQTGVEILVHADPKKSAIS